MKHIYQLKISIKDSDPLIWRSIQVSNEISFSELHDVIQISMGWEGGHLYEFTFKNIRIYDFEAEINDGSNPTERDSADTFLDEIVQKVKSKFTYVYDFGDHWEHMIILEKILPDEEGEDKIYPLCIDGDRACPPEDVGGISRYQDILQILMDKNHPEYDTITKWMGEDWNADSFDCDGANNLLQDYSEQWDDIDEETGEIIEYLGEDIFLNQDDDREFDELKKFTCPEDVIRNEEEHSDMVLWLDSELEENHSREHQTFERLMNLGFDELKGKTLVLEALSIEWYYDLKYGTDHLEARYSYNLEQLPQKPLELPRSEDALAVLDNCTKGVPFLAIEHLQDDPSYETKTAILKALKNHSDHQYCWEDCTNAPFFYALAAEGHICEELIDPVIQLYEDNNNDTDWLFDQGQYLIGKLAQKYPDMTALKVLEAMEADVDKNSKPCVFYLFDAFHFCDIEKYQTRLLALLEIDRLYWYDPLAMIIAQLQIAEGLPILKKKLALIKTEDSLFVQNHGSVVEIEDAIQVLEGKLILDEDFLKPLFLTRKGTWKDELKEKEAFFYEDEYVPNYFDYPFDTPFRLPEFPNTQQPYIKEKKPERNDPCPCGSGKKYKKCCIDKDE